MSATQDFINQHKDRFLTELLELLRIPSVSADSRHKADVKKAAEYIQEKLKAAGADKAELYETKGHPIVYGEVITGSVVISAGIDTNQVTA